MPDSDPRRKTLIATSAAFAALGIDLSDEDEDTSNG